MRLGMLLGFAFLTGLGLGPLLDVVIMVNPAIIPNAFMMSAIIFASFSGAALFAPDGQVISLVGDLLFFPRPKIHLIASCKLSRGHGSLLQLVILSEPFWTVLLVPLPRWYLVQRHVRSHVARHHQPFFPISTRVSGLWWSLLKSWIEGSTISCLIYRATFGERCSYSVDSLCGILRWSSRSVALVAMITFRIHWTFSSTSFKCLGNSSSF